MHAQEIVTTGNRTRYVVVDEQDCLCLPVVRYLKYLDSIGRARNTLRCYAHNLALFFRYLTHRQIAYGSVTLDDMAGFVLWLKTPSCSASVSGLPGASARAAATVNLVLTTVSGFYDYLWRQEDLAANLSELTRTQLPARSRSYKGFLHHLAQERSPATSLLRQKEPRRRILTLSREQVQALVHACNSQRDKLLLTLLYESSVRIGEALALWIEDIDIPRCQLCIRDRGELENAAEIKTPTSCRSVDVSRDLINQILDYLAVAHTEQVQTNHIFLKQQGPNAGKPLAYTDVNDLFARLQCKTGILASAHLLRHSSLTQLAQAGWKPEHLRQRAGHAQMQSTYQMYVHPSDSELRQAWEKTRQHVTLKACQEKS